MHLHKKVIHIEIAFLSYLMIDLYQKLEKPVPVLVSWSR